MLYRTSLLATAALALASCSEGPSPISATGSSTVYPFTKLVADAFIKQDGKHKAAIESTGTDSGIQAFCSKDAVETPDILDASRRITRNELGVCKTNGVAEIMEVPIGLDGIAVAESTEGPKLELTSKDLYLALAANPNGKPNAAKNWSDVNPKLPAIPILVLGPPESSGTHDMFASLILRAGCLAVTPEAAELERGSDPSKFTAACLAIRSDGPYVAQGEDDDKIVAALEKNPRALGLFGYSYLEQNAQKLRAVPIDGVMPTAETIAGGKYLGFRSLYLYVNKARIAGKPALKGFLQLYMQMSEPAGPLDKRGLVPMSERARKASAETVENEYALTPQDL